MKNTANTSPSTMTADGKLSTSVTKTHYHTLCTGSNMTGM